MQNGPPPEYTKVGQLAHDKLLHDKWAPNANRTRSREITRNVAFGEMQLTNNAKSLRDFSMRIACLPEVYRRGALRKNRRQQSSGFDFNLLVSLI